MRILVAALLTFHQGVDREAVRPHPVLMNVTVSIDDKILERARQLAQERGTSLDQIIQEFLEGLTASDPIKTAAALERLWNEEEGDSGGWTWNREEIHDRPLLR